MLFVFFMFSMLFNNCLPILVELFKQIHYISMFHPFSKVTCCLFWYLNGRDVSFGS